MQTPGATTKTKAKTRWTNVEPKKKNKTQIFGETHLVPQWQLTSADIKLARPEPERTHTQPLASPKVSKREGRQVENKERMNVSVESRMEMMVMCLPSDDFQPRWDQWFAPDVCQDCGASDFIEGTLHSWHTSGIGVFIVGGGLRGREVVADDPLLLLCVYT